MSNDTPIREHYLAVGDTLTPLGCQLRQIGTDGLYANVNLTGLVVKFKMVSENDTVVVEETTTGVTVVTPASGLVQYDFQDADVATAGTYYGWFVVYNGTEHDTYPIGRRLRIIIEDRA